MGKEIALKYFDNQSTRNPTPSISGFYFYSNGRLSSVSLHGRRNLPSLSFLDGLEGKHFPATIQHSCNGLLLFHTRYVDRNGYLLPLYIVCNPTTNKHTVLPKTGFSSRLACRRRGPYLAFDPSKSPHYKVVVVSLYHTQSFEIDVYNSETRNWKNIEIDVRSLGTRNWINIFFPGKTSCGRGVFWNGAIHWLSSNNSVLKFDIDAEKMLTFPLPQRPTLLPQNNISYLGECGGGLILVQTNLLSIEICRILELEGDNIHWIENYRVDLRAFQLITDALVL
ncbi:F-box protein At5g07610-like [Rhododendron vialii]|uniref:F-box protein At5g07610-like n=1 Tax=Rhododendron vialii TaxID=182163 RepID=UPI00265F6EC2|nr:F-box protein At5g07610-like [Rhododendron vialii]